MPPKERTSFDKSSDAKGTHTKTSETEEQNAGDAERKEEHCPRKPSQPDKGNGKRSSFIRKTLSSAEIVLKDPPKDESTPKVLIAWKAFKCIVFLICLTYLIKQSAEFYWHFRTYPTNSNTRIEVSKDKFKLPAATLCYKNR
ncbi:hypothetical protein AVEN_107192-1 [Araneus ventricosus]|uniref:Uncharacterized protein n=1 Tax=Araneus ventricosus TaxID=182803 RepID=A0A4Y2JE60_ARAVE|nr:hypothetical protein AVEN_107192-1 [Araneus ventricosus]